MTFDETLKFLDCVDAVYPTKEQNGNALTLKAQMWHTALKNITYAQAYSALQKYFETSISGYAPQAADILGIIRKSSGLSDTEIQMHINRALRDSLYHSAEQFECLPDDLKRIIGHPSELKMQASRTEADANIFIRSVIKEYKTRIESGTLDNKLIVSKEVPMLGFSEDLTGWIKKIE